RTMLPQQFDDATAELVVDSVRAPLEHAPRDGVLLGLHYLALATKANDAARADALRVHTLATLAAEPRPLAAFADLVLRGDRQRAGLAAALRPALEAAV